MKRRTKILVIFVIALAAVLLLIPFFGPPLFEQADETLGHVAPAGSNLPAGSAGRAQV